MGGGDGFRVASLATMLTAHPQTGPVVVRPSSWGHDAIYKVFESPRIFHDKSWKGGEKENKFRIGWAGYRRFG